LEGDGLWLMKHAGSKGRMNSGRCRSGTWRISTPAWTRPEVQGDLDRAAKMSSEFQERFKGKLAEMAAGGNGGARLAEAIAEYEAIEEVMGRLGSFAGLIYSGDTTDPDARQVLWRPAGPADLYLHRPPVFTLELNRIEDAVLDNALQTPALGAYRPWVEDLRLERPYQLDDNIERLFHEKSVTGRGAWTGLFDETLAASSSRSRARC
jgi:oligoendopeptidase F